MIGEKWTGFIWETDSFGEPEDAIDLYELAPGDVLELEEVESTVVAIRRWIVRDDRTLEPAPAPRDE